MQLIPVGAMGSFSLLVTPEHLAGRFKDVTLPPVLATPVMIMVMENAALNVDGRRIEFSIHAVEGDEEIGVGTHERVVILLSKLAERMKAKFG
jgi:fluoroacetyl-CoA thioesterase